MTFLRRLLRVSSGDVGKPIAESPRREGVPSDVTQSSAYIALDIAHTFGLTGSAAALKSMSAEELSTWENRDVPSANRGSDRSEAVADERQDVTTSLNYPLHWTSPRESWDYMFDFAVACDLLAPRPDDRILDLASGTCWATEIGRASCRERVWIPV